MSKTPHFSDRKLVMRPVCPLHHEAMVIKHYSGERYAGISYFGCPIAYCQWRVGRHKDSGDPLGTPADDKIREGRKAAHAAFDPLWRGQNPHFEKRNHAYAWLKKQLGMHRDQCHIAMFGSFECAEVVRVVKEFLTKHPPAAPKGKTS